MGSESLKFLEKSLKFLFKKGYEPWVYAVVQFYPWFKFYFPSCLGIVMYDNEVTTKGNKIKPRRKLNHNLYFWRTQQSRPLLPSLFPKFLCGLSSAIGLKNGISFLVYKTWDVKVHLILSLNFAYGELLDVLYLPVHSVNNSSFFLLEDDTPSRGICDYVLTGFSIFIFICTFPLAIFFCLKVVLILLYSFVLLRDVKKWYMYLCSPWRKGGGINYRVL